MFSQDLISLFVHDKLVVAIAVLLLIDLALGVLASLKNGTFRLAYVSDFLRNDLLGKVLPYYVLWAGLHVADVDFSVVGLNGIDTIVGGLVAAALAASVLNSLRDLGLAAGLGDGVAGADPNSKLE